MAWVTVSAIVVAVKVLNVSICDKQAVHDYKRDSKLLVELELEEDDQKNGYGEDEKKDKAELGVWN